jgi:hypothetical protein
MQDMSNNRLNCTPPVAVASHASTLLFNLLVADHEPRWAWRTGRPACRWCAVCGAPGPPRLGQAHRGACSRWGFYCSWMLGLALLMQGSVCFALIMQGSAFFALGSCAFVAPSIQRVQARTDWCTTGLTGERAAGGASTAF